MKRAKLTKHPTNMPSTLKANKDVMKYKYKRKQSDIWTDDDKDALYRAAQLGLTTEQIAHMFCCSVVVFYSAQKKYPELKDIITAGRANAIKYVTEKLWGKISEGNLNAIIFYLRCRGGWKPTEILEVADEAHKDGEEVKGALSTLEDAELTQLGHLLAEAHKRKKERDSNVDVATTFRHKQNKLH